VTVSTSQPKLSEALANFGHSNGSMTDRRVREQLGGRRSSGSSLSEYKGIVLGQYSNLVGDWNDRPSADGNLYKGFDEQGGAYPPAAHSITFHAQGTSPDVTSVKLLGASPGGGTLNDRSMEVICAGTISEGGSYRFEFDVKAYWNAFYNNVAYKFAVASSTLGHLAGETQLDAVGEQTINLVGSNFKRISDTVSLVQWRPYVCLILYALHRSGGSPFDPVEGFEFRNARLTKL
jgi:hypothetical protein